MEATKEKIYDVAPDEFTQELISDIMKLTKEERKELLVWMKGGLQSGQARERPYTR